MKYKVTVNGKQYDVEIEGYGQTPSVAPVQYSAPAPAPAPVVAAPAPAPVAAAPAPAAPAPVASAPQAPIAGGTKIESPMPGSIHSVVASVGQQVKKGDVVLILEAMKMENEIVSPCDGTVGQILVSKGQSVNTDTILAVIN